MANTAAKAERPELENIIEKATEEILSGLQKNGHDVVNSDDRCLVLNVLRKHLYKVPAWER
jgi:hypothetical protein